MPQNQNNNKKITGNNGENRACRYLIEKEYSIIGRNWRTKEGEIDIIAKKQETLVFVEVKTLPNATSDMLCRVLNARKRQHILKTAKCFLQNHRQYNDCYIRFDVIVLDMQGFPETYHIENAFCEK